MHTNVRLEADIVVTPPEAMKQMRELAGVATVSDLIE